MLHVYLLPLMKLSKHLYHCLGDYFNPYSDFFSLHTIFSFPAVLKLHRLKYIDLLFEIVMEKGGLHIELIKIQLILCYQHWQNPNRRVLCNRWEYLVVVNTFLLCVAFSYQSGFITYNIIFERSLFLYIYPLTANCLLSLGQLCQFSSVILV